MTHGCEGCGQYFKTAQGLGSHRNSCSVVQYQRQQQVQQHGMVLSALGAPAAPPVSYHVPHPSQLNTQSSGLSPAS
jgi:hypothetical protein